ncbi:MAG: hypothetical protein AAFP70_01240, partial [Calditrichota bacterium]
MRPLHIFLGFALLLPVALVAQQSSKKLADLEQRFRAQEFDAVLQLGDSLLTSGLALEENDLIRIYEIQAIVFYTRDELQNSLFSFLSILELNSSHELDPVRTSPKIRNYFEEIRRDFLAKKRLAEQNRSRRQEQIDSLQSAIEDRSLAQVRGSMIRSILLPGWGHLHSGKRNMGWTLTALSLSSLGIGTWFSIETASRENDYLNETNPLLIQPKYNSFNDAYQLRNSVYLAFAALWVYSQIDLFYFSSSPAKGTPFKKSLSYIPGVSVTPT